MTVTDGTERMIAFTVAGRVKLQALVYDILPLEEGAGKRCSECEGECDSIKRPSTKNWVRIGLPSKLFDITALQASLVSNWEISGSQLSV